MKIVLLLAPLAAAAFPHQGRPQPHPRAKALARPAVRANVLATGLKAYSLNGFPGHRFGESRSNFPELEARGYADLLTGLVSYSLRDGQQGPGWFAKNADQVSSTYWFC